MLFVGDGGTPVEMLPGELGGAFSIDRLSLFCSACTGAVAMPTFGATVISSTVASGAGAGEGAAGVGATILISTVVSMLTCAGLLAGADPDFLFLPGAWYPLGSKGSVM